MSHEVYVGSASKIKRYNYTLSMRRYDSLDIPGYRAMVQKSVKIGGYIPSPSYHRIVDVSPHDSSPKCVEVSFTDPYQVSNKGGPLPAFF